MSIRLMTDAAPFRSLGAQRREFQEEEISYEQGTGEFR